MEANELPAWFNNLTLAGLALAPLTVAIAQVIKVVGARLGMPEGYGGYITLAVSVLVVIVALAAGVFQVEAEAAAALQVAHRVAEAVLTLLAALGWYEAGKHAQIIRPVRWQRRRV